MITIPKQKAKSFILKKNHYLKVVDVNGQQVSDMVAFNHHDVREKISSGKTIDFEETIFLTTGNILWSNRSNKMLEIVEDTNGRNDFLLAPCSQETFEIMHNISEEHPSCLDNLTKNLFEYNIEKEDIPTAFNIFMNVEVNPDGKVSVLPPTSRPGDSIVFKALMDLIVCLTACSSEHTNGGSCKPIAYEILENH
ncbi:MAG: urea carboxylase-associated family protein [Flavobacteriaceae bacterium]|nr:urea carboxylase-associated family protein [Flavobacteriaceae bacterium]